MTRRMLINAIHPEECRVAVAENDRLLELEVERAGYTQLKGNIYKAAITRIEPSLQAAFLDIDANRNGFLQINDINPAYFHDWPPKNGSRERTAIQNALSSGQELVVQVLKDEREAKGATLTTNLSIPGRYLVLMIGNQRGGVSRKISDESQRSRLRQVVQNLSIPAGMGVIVRTAGINKGSAELQHDLDGLLEIWYDIIAKSYEPGAPILLYRESNLAIRTIRDYLSPDIEEIIIDERGSYENAREFIEKTLPSFGSRVKFFEGPEPLFTKYNLDAQIEETNQSEVTLPSGGSIVINAAEAVVAVDVNSGRATSQADVEETAFETNKEAADAIVRQLRLRDLGGLIVIDFIDMIDRRHKLIVEKTLRDAIRKDKAKIEIGRISKFGLLEMSRQRMKSSLVSQSHMVCPHCEGRGKVKTVDSAALEALRKIQSTVFAGGIEEVRVRMAPAAALRLLNNKRHVLTEYEQLSNTTILVYADGRMKPEQYELELISSREQEQNPPRRSTSRRQAYSDRKEEPRQQRDEDGSRSSGPRSNRNWKGKRQGQSRNSNNQGRSRRPRNQDRSRRSDSRDRRGPQRKESSKENSPPNTGSDKKAERPSSKDESKSSSTENKPVVAAQEIPQG